MYLISKLIFQFVYIGVKIENVNCVALNLLKN